MKTTPIAISDFNNAIEIAATKTSVSKKEWIKNGKIIELIRQKTLADFFKNKVKLKKFETSLNAGKGFEPLHAFT